MKVKLAQASFTFYLKVGKMLISYNRGGELATYTCTFNLQYMGAITVPGAEKVSDAKAYKYGKQIIATCKQQRIS